MWRRGANLEGDAANFIETEQVLEFEGYKSSFLQVCISSYMLSSGRHLLSYSPNVESDVITSCLNERIIYFTHITTFFTPQLLNI